MLQYGVAIATIFKYILIRCNCMKTYLVTMRLEEEQYRRLEESAKENDRGIGAQARYELFFEKGDDEDE